MSIDTEIEALQRRYPGLPFQDVIQAINELSRRGPEGDPVFTDVQLFERIPESLWARAILVLGLLASEPCALLEIHWRLLESDGQFLPLSADTVARALAYNLLLHPATGELITEGFGHRISSFYRARVRAVEPADQPELN